MTDNHGTVTTVAQLREQLNRSDTRALLVSLDDEDRIACQPVRYGQSVVNIDTDLRSHLEAKPRTDQWLTELRDYLTHWLEVRAGAIRAGLVMPIDNQLNMGVMPWPRS